MERRDAIGHLIDISVHSASTDERVSARLQIIEKHAALVEQRDRLVNALEGLIHDLPADERLATMIFSLDRAERVLEEVKRCQQ